MNPRVRQALERGVETVNRSLQVLQTDEAQRANLDRAAQRPLAVQLVVESAEGPVDLTLLWRDGRVHLLDSADSSVKASSNSSAISSGLVGPDVTSHLVARVRVPFSVFDWVESRDAGEDARAPSSHLTSRMWLAAEQAYETLTREKAAFDIVVTDGPWADEGESTTMRVALGVGATLDAAECTATLHYQDIWSFSRGDMPLMDLLFGHTQLTGDATQAIRLLMALYTPLNP